MGAWLNRIPQNPPGTPKFPFFTPKFPSLPLGHASEQTTPSEGSIPLYGALTTPTRGGAFPQAPPAAPNSSRRRSLTSAKRAELPARPRRGAAVGAAPGAACPASLPVPPGSGSVRSRFWPCFLPVRSRFLSVRSRFWLGAVTVGLPAALPGPVRSRSRFSPWPASVPLLSSFWPGSLPVLSCFFPSSLQVSVQSRWSRLGPGWVPVRFGDVGLVPVPVGRGQFQPPRLPEQRLRPGRAAPVERHRRRFRFRFRFGAAALPLLTRFCSRSRF